MGESSETKPVKDVNSVTFSGRATRDAQRRGKTTVFGLAVHSLERVDGEVVEVTNFYDVTVFEPAAGPCAKYVRKGRRVVITGRLSFDEYEATYDDDETIYRDEAQQEPVMKLKPRLLTSDVQFI